MGNGSSISTSNPFPVNEKIVKNLARLSYGTARILNTEDIYYLFNLNKPGPCGNYAIFKKKNIGIKLLPFIADISGAAQEFLYQDSFKAVSNDIRKEVCDDLAKTMLRTVSIIVACMASIQIYSSMVKARYDEVVPPTQRGGDNTIKDWLSRHNYIKASADDVYTLKDKPSLMLDFMESKDYSIEATLTDTSSLKTIRLIFLEPVAVDAQERGVAVCMADEARTLACGILYNNEYLPFDLSKRRRNFGEFSQTLMTSPIRTEPATSYQLFLIINRLIEENKDKAIAELLARHFSSTSGLGSLGGLGNRGTGLGLGDRGLGNGLGLGLGNGLGLGLGNGLGLGLGRGLGDRGIGLAARSLQVALGQRSNAFPFANVGPQTGGPIKGPAQQYILKFFENCRKMVPIEESPAARRVRTIVTGEDANRRAQPNICQDPYWTKANLGEIYPWATLQFLSVKDWNSLGTPDVKLEPEFADFLTNLRNLYKDKLVIVAKKDGKRLEDLSFSGISKLALCQPGKEIKAFDIKVIQDLLAQMNILYANHVENMTAIINSLIIEIDDQNTKVYRLNPNIFKSGKATSIFINEKAKEARTKLSAFYIQVETIYLEIIKRLAKT
jgi:hypothetical protein